MDNADLKNDDFDKLIRGKNINFLIGAGASVPLYPTLTLGERCPSFEDVVSDKGISDEARIFMYLYYFTKWIAPMGEERENLDEQSNNVFLYYNKLIQHLYGFLHTESNERPKRANIFSTNYDLLFERTFDDFSERNPLVYFNDGSRGFFKKYISNQNFYLNVTHSGYNDNYRREVPTINLFKLHGSVSWRIERDRIMVADNNPDIAKIWKKIEAIGIGLEEMEDIIAHIEAGGRSFATKLNEHVSALHLDRDKLKDFFAAYEKIPIINPDKNKFSDTVAEQHYYQMIRSFSYELERKQTVLIIFGFSFADEHITDILKRSLLNPELQVVIISYSEEDQKKHQNLFDGYRNIAFLPKNCKEQKGDFPYLLFLLGERDE